MKRHGDKPIHKLTVSPFQVFLRTIKESHSLICWLAKHVILGLFITERKVTSCTRLGLRALISRQRKWVLVHLFNKPCSLCWVAFILCYSQAARHKIMDSDGSRYRSTVQCRVKSWEGGELPCGQTQPSDIRVEKASALTLDSRTVLMPS